ncbi:MAG: TIGR04190 family B12-binding domain/radical SAM domain protein [Thermofilum sp.]
MLMRRFDVALVHAPSVYDFRKRGYVHYGPISDVIPSKPVFDMYPAGFFTLTSYLEKNGVRVGIFNLAAKMVNDERFDVPRFIRKLDADVYAVDLHWLVHAHGALEVARLIKELKGAPVVLGGLSSTYYWWEILSRYEFVDAVVLGDTTEPCFLQLVEKLQKGDENLEGVCNVAYRAGSRVRFNGISFVPEHLDEYAADYGLVLRAMVRSGISLSLPWSSFLEHPVTAVITYKGCLHNCLACGGSNFAYSTIYRRKAVGVKKPETLVEEFKGITERLKAPIFFVNDLQLLGKSYIEKLMKLLADEKSDVEIFFEFFVPPERDVLELYRRAGDRVYLHLSPESHEDNVRRRYGRPYTNSQIRNFIRNAVELSFERIDLYFMVGLPGQTPSSVQGLGGFFKELYEDARGKLEAFVAPLAPFVDPGSLAFHMPSRMGYRILAHRLSEHRELLLAEKWFEMLNYETELMSREQVAEATYNAVLSLTEAKLQLGLLGEEEFSRIKASVEAARSGQHVKSFREKETLREDELYPKRKIPLQYMTLRLVGEIIRYAVTQA